MSEPAASSVPADLLQLFLELVGIDGPSGHERPVADFIRRRLEPLGIEVQEDDAGQAAGGDCGNLICRWRGGSAVALAAHLDTVQSTAGLEPRLLEDRIVADPRGILGADNRAGVAAIVHALEHHVIDDGGPATALFTVREEVDLTGASRIEWPGELEAAYVLDSSLRPGAWIVTGWGARRFSAYFAGRAAHAAIAPEGGVHAILAAAQAITGVTWGRLGDDSTANVGTISGGTATNVVAAETTVTGEVRSASAIHLDELVAAVTARFEEAARAFGADLELTWTAEFEPYRHAADAPAIQRLVRAMRHAGLEAHAETTAGGSDAHLFNARGLPTVNLGIGAQNPHGPQEHILLADLAAAARLARALLAGDP